ncbi:MAG: protein-L-isoaspartate(D-aspartate) O-methyltransferase [Desulfovibrionales bacterium]
MQLLKDSDARARERKDMVEYQLKRRGISDPQVLHAMETVPRHLFVPENERHNAYADGPVPIGKGQTISQPYIVAYMTEALKLTRQEKVLEIGTGMGYQAAVLSRIAREVYTVERIPELLQKAESTFRRLGYDNIHTRSADGTMGLPSEAPFDAIIVTAGSPEIPEPLMSQLAIGGKMVIPVGAHRLSQDIMRVTRTSDAEYASESLLSVAFVPLIGDHGWKDQG